MLNKLYVKIKNNIWEIVSVLALILVYLILNVKLPYIIYMPGGTSNLSKSIKVVDENINTGEYNSLYVSTIESTIFTYLIAKVNNNWDIVSDDEIKIDESENLDDINFRDTLLLKKSKIDALKVAYNKANKDYKITDRNIYIIGNDTNYDIKIGEILKKIDNQDINSREDVSRILSEKDKNGEIIIETLYNDETIRRNIKLRYEDNRNIMGLYLIEIDDLKLEYDVYIDSKKNESGGSAGLMIALAIYDKLADIDLSENLRIVGTGTIDEDGNVGKIDGLKHKMLGLKKVKHDIFFVPYDNYEEALEINKKYKLNLKITPVKTFDEAVNYILNVNK